ncbi:MAG: aspartyl protease family protein [Desulfuromonadales bacterium]|nr:aspartyl protease family protein [Desulfuromonadales bacterium]MBN2792460.1 aspartyl protease family protein [Desulfuromonadales bacterium]
MTIIRWLFLCCVISCIFPDINAYADIYRWRDAQGKWHFSDSPQNVPAQLREKAREDKTTSGNLNIISSGSQSSQAKSTQRRQDEKGLDENLISIPFTAKEGLADRVIIDVTFNNSITAPILVDTGSPGLVLSSDLASALGLIDPDGNNMLVLISGIGGSKVATRAIVDKLSLGTITEKFIPAHIIPQQATAYQGLIGMDILSQYSLTIDSAHRRLIAHKRPPAEDRPGGRSRSWWQKNFRELAYYIPFWQEQAELLDQNNSPYSRLTSSYERVKSFIRTQQEETQKLYDQLERYARSHSVPRHWRQ